MNYWFDRSRKKVFYAMVILVDIDNPTEVPMTTSVPVLLAQERFLEVPVDSLEYPHASLT